MAECGSVCETEVNVNLLVQLKEKLGDETLILCSKRRMEAYLCWVYIRDTPTQSVPRVQMHCMSKNGVIYYQQVFDILESLWEGARG